MEDDYIRGRRAKLILFEDSMSDVDEKMLEEIFDKFNETGCTSFRVTTEQLRQLTEQGYIEFITRENYKGCKL